MTGGFFVASGVVIGAGLLIDWSLLPRPSTIAAAPALLAFDIAERQADEERYESLVNKVRLLRLGEERRDGEFGPKEFPAAPAAPETKGSLAK